MAHEQAAAVAAHLKSQDEPSARGHVPDVTFVRVPEAMRRLGGCSDWKVYKLNRLGLLEMRKLGTITLVSVASINALLDGLEPRPVGQVIPRAKRGVRKAVKAAIPRT